MAFSSEHSPKRKPGEKQMQPSSTTFNRTYPQAQLTPSSASEHLAQQNPYSNHAATCSVPINPFSTTTNIEPPFLTSVIHPTYGHTAPIPLCWGGPPHPRPPAPASENASLIKAFTDTLTSKKHYYRVNLLEKNSLFGLYFGITDVSVNQKQG